MPTTFVTGASGFIGREVVARLVTEGHRVLAMTRGGRGGGGGERLRAMGAEVVVGDLLAEGGWRAAAERAELVVHLAQPLAFGRGGRGDLRVTQARAERYRENRLRIDDSLFSATRGAQRIVYVAGTSYYGATGLSPVGEDAIPRPRGWGPFLAPAVERATREAERGAPLVIAFPGYVYGDGSWFRDYVLRPLRAGARLNVLGGRSRMGSPVHVGDCARALTFLLSRGEPGARYFVVDDEPQPWSTFYTRAAQALDVPLRVRTVPAWALRALVGPVVADSVDCDAALSNRRLRSLGFELEYPTTATGIADVVGRARMTGRVPSIGRMLWELARGLARRG